MAKKSATEKSATVVGMEARRERILGQARRLLGEADAEAFSLRKLADASGVTVPTLYNLIGNRDAILLELASQMVDRVETELAQLEDDDPLEMAEAVIERATAMFAEDEEFHRAAHVAFHSLALRGANPEARARSHRRCAELQHKAIQEAVKRGLLRGELDGRDLAEQIFRNYSQAANEWTFRTIDLATFRTRALRGVYLYFLADATEAYRLVLVEKLAALDTKIRGAA